jgi:hypothetical protein
LFGTKKQSTDVRFDEPNEEVHAQEKAVAPTKCVYIDVALQENVLLRYILYAASLHSFVKDIKSSFKCYRAWDG